MPFLAQATGGLAPAGLGYSPPEVPFTYGKRALDFPAPGDKAVSTGATSHTAAKRKKAPMAHLQEDLWYGAATGHVST